MMLSHTLPTNVWRNTLMLSLLVWLTLIGHCSAWNNNQLQDGLDNKDDYQQDSLVQGNTMVALDSDLQEANVEDKDKLLEDRCPEGYMLLVDQCLNIRDHKLSWMEAEEDCARQSGHLAIVRDTEAMKSFITKMNIQENLWLGASKYKDQEGCPVGFTLIGSQCLLMGSEKLSWDEAKDKCDWYSAQLVTVHNPHTLKHYIGSYFSEASFWIGGKFQRDTGTWDWISGVEVNSSFPWSSYGHGKQPLKEDNQNCMVLRYFSVRAQHEYVGYQCGIKNHYICEKPKVKMDEWRWVSGLQVDPDFPWSRMSDDPESGGPVQQQYHGEPGHNCMLLLHYFHQQNLYHYVNSSSCNDTYPYVCEVVAAELMDGGHLGNIRTGRAMRESIENINALDSQLLMDDYYGHDDECEDDLFVFSFENKCYKIDELKTPCDPCNECPSKGYSLAQPEQPDLLWEFIDTSGHYPYLSKNHMSYAGPLVIGGRGNGKDFVWDNGSKIDSSWWEREPRSVKDINCLVMGSHSSKTAILKTQMCSENWIILCEQTGPIEESEDDYYDYNYESSDYDAESDPSKTTSQSSARSDPSKTTSQSSASSDSSRNTVLSSARSDSSRNAGQYSPSSDSSINTGQASARSDPSRNTGQSSASSDSSRSTGQSSVRSSDIKPKDLGNNSCEDSTLDCLSWESHCYSNSAVRDKCPKTCKTCGASTTNTCEDMDPNCKHWKTYCESNPAVRGKCKATCGGCQASLGGSNEECADKDTKCKYWKEHCDSNKEVRKKCPLTCGQCNKPSG